MCNVSLQSSHKMVTVLPANQTASTISHRPMRAQPTGNDSIEAGGLPDCELNCEKISRWTTKLRVWKYIWIKLASLLRSTVDRYWKYQIEYLSSKHVCLYKSNSMLKLSLPFQLLETIMLKPLYNFKFQFPFPNCFNQIWLNFQISGDPNRMHY